MPKERAWAWHQFGQLKTCADLETYLSGREYEHGGYFHYTTLATVDHILSNQEFWLSNVGGFNDTRDSEQFGAGPLPFFSLCFSTGIHENLPLWYLYSGVDGCGARLHLTKSWVRDLIQHGTFHLCRTEKDQVVETIMPLNVNETIDLAFRDVIYAQARNDGYYALKYNTMTNYQIPIQEFEQYQLHHIGFCKGLIWFYEKETRLLVRLKGEAETEWKTRQKVAPNQTYRVTLSFDDSLYKRIRITLAPNISQKDTATLFKDMTGLQTFLTATARIQPSQYQGTINLRLCDNCAIKREQQAVSKQHQ